eukprot:gnl/TRDRNA2_/TRDRNA2_203864_c0_seq1.p1 gnl/TRDRNA2_/TRDRNA2_203864_c0~~gnl/TRDRNA2_/TRDRNA2_203864_c0_seq1.p1  ORF type:complete len:153 (-),score=29.26 gnl/TRDRNA2_/TRDRNA2_203864_c0_seq1:89-547(-)
MPTSDDQVSTTSSTESSRRYKVLAVDFRAEKKDDGNVGYKKVRNLVTSMADAVKGGKRTPPGQSWTCDALPKFEEEDGPDFTKDSKSAPPQHSWTCDALPPMGNSFNTSDTLPDIPEGDSASETDEGEQNKAVRGSGERSGRRADANRFVSL